MPPHSVESEQALIACCILEGGQESLTECIEAKISADSFYKPSHRIVFAALMDLYQQGSPIDEVILGEALKSKNQFDEIGGYAYINEVVNRIDTPAHLKYYIERVRDLHLLRRLIQCASQALDRAYTGQEYIEQFLEEVEQDIFRISEDRISDTAHSIKETIEGAVAIVTKMIQNRGQLTGVTSGFRDLDKLTSGLHAQEMIVVAARPSMGKTSIMLNMAEAVLVNPDPKKRVPVLLFSLEMGADQIAMRLLCSVARVDMQKLRDGRTDQQSEAALAQAAKDLKNVHLWIDDCSDVSILEMKAKARRMHAKHKLGLILIDYLQLISGTDPRLPREQQIAEISRGIKAMAKELKVPVVVAAQLNRDSEKERRQPKLSDLRESGSIEQDADLVLLISKQKENQEEDKSASILLRDLIIAKQRNGPVGNVTLAFNRKLTKYENYSSENEF